MAGQSITFDFLSRGAASLARDFRSVGDESALSSRGVKVLQDVIEKLGAKENRTAAESALLAKALRQTGDAADRVTARAVLADAAIRRLGDAEQDASKKSDNLGKALGSLKLNPGLIGPALALAPAIATLGGVVAAVGVGLAGAFTAGAGALAAFGAVAKPVLTDAKTAAAAVEKAQNNYAIAIANGTKQSVAYKAEQVAIAKAYAELSPAQIKLSKQLEAMGNAWQAVKAAQTPVVAGALQPWLKSVTDLMKNLGPIIAKVAPVIAYLGTQFDALVNSAAFKAFRDFIGSTGAAAVSAGGSTIIALVKSFIILLPQFDPLIREAVGWISRLGPAVLAWASSKRAADQIQSFLQWFSANGPVVGTFLKNIGGALKALAPGLTSGGMLELKLISDFFGWVAKLPPSLARPLAEVAAVLLILNKMGVVKAGVNLVGLAAGAGPIGLIAAALAAVAIGFTIAWQKSSTFRDVIKELGVVMLQVGIVIIRANQAIINSFLALIGTILHGLVDAFGWIPGLGPKLRAASKDFDNFKAGVNGVFNSIIATMKQWQDGLNASKTTAANALHSIGLSYTGAGVLANTAAGNANAFNQALTRLPKKTTVTLTETGSGTFTIKQLTGQGLGVQGPPPGVGKAAGGRITGPGGPRSDTAGLFALSNGEWVIRADSAARYGPAAMNAVNQGKAVIGYAAGGSIGALAGETTGFHDRFVAAVTKAMEAAMTAAMKVAISKAQAAAAAVGGIGNYKPGAGVQQWRGVVSTALAQAGSSQQLIDAVLYQMQTESGGNPTIVNKWDSNWLAGHPSVGLMQVIRGTFQAYAGRYRNTGPFAYGVSENPLANVYAAIKYAQANYGPGLRNAYGGIGTGHGYAAGTDWAQPGLAWVGERGPELVRFRGGEQVIPGDGLTGLRAELRALRAEIRQLTGVAAGIPAATGAHVGGAINGAAGAAAFRNRFPQGGW